MFHLAPALFPILSCAQWELTMGSTRVSPTKERKMKNPRNPALFLAGAGNLRQQQLPTCGRWSLCPLLHTLSGSPLCANKASNQGGKLSKPRFPLSCNPSFLPSSQEGLTELAARPPPWQGLHEAIVSPRQLWPAQTEYLRPAASTGRSAPLWREACGGSQAQQLQIRGPWTRVPCSSMRLQGHPFLFLLSVQFAQCSLTSWE